MGPKRKWVGPVVSGNMCGSGSVLGCRGEAQIGHAQGRDAGDKCWVLLHSGVGSDVDFTRSTRKTKMDRF